MPSLPTFGFINDLHICFNLLWERVKTLPDYYTYLEGNWLHLREAFWNKIVNLHQDIANLKTYFRNAVSRNINTIKSLLSSLGVRTTGLLDAFEALWRRTKARIRSIFEPTVRMLINIGQGLETTVLDAKNGFLSKCTKIIFL